VLLAIYLLSVIVFQGESIEKLAVKQSKLRVIDLGSNRLKSAPKALLKNSPHLNALYLDNNRLSHCSQIHVLRRASDLEYVDLSENQLLTFEKNCFDVLVAGVTIKLSGNPFQCTCETTAVVEWLAGDACRGLEIADRDSITCSGPSELSGTRILVPEGSSTLPGSWECYWQTDVVVAVIVLLGLTLFVIGVVHARRHIMLRRHTRTNSSPSGQNGSVSSVTISNSCYGIGNGSASGPGNTGATSVPGSGESNACYSPLIEDDLATSGDQQVPVEPSSTRRSAVSDDIPCSLVVGNGGLQRKQQLMPADISGADQTATSCGEIDNEALLPCHEMEESV